LVVSVKVTVPNQLAAGVKVTAAGAAGFKLPNVPAAGSEDVQVAEVADPPKPEPDNVIAAGVAD
jgi:hypothetical protein